MPNEADIASAIADLTNQKTRNFSGTANKHKVDRKTLQRRFYGQSEPSWIDALTNRKLPPTPGMIKSHVERLVDRSIGKNWVSDFYNRHQDRLNRKYVDGVDANRVYATANPKCYQLWFQNVFPFT